MNSIKADKVNETSQKLQEIIDAIETKEERWLELSMKLEPPPKQRICFCTRLSYFVILAKEMTSINLSST